MRFEWTSDLETGVDVIDDDHKLIIDLYNRIYYYYNNESDILLLERAISDFRFLFSLHFLKEENFMIEIGYPDFESHAREHEAMVRLLNKFTGNARDKEESCHKIAFLVLQWLTSHLEGADRRLAAFTRQPPPLGEGEALVGHRFSGRVSVDR
ncbi:MAG: hemerythrin family protein [Rhodospirillaceae bacterium]